MDEQKILEDAQAEGQKVVARQHVVKIEFTSPLTDSIVDLWFVETFHNLGLDAPLFNRFSAARDELKARLAAAKEA